MARVIAGEIIAARRVRGPSFLYLTLISVRTRLISSSRERQISRIRFQTVTLAETTRVVLFRLANEPAGSAKVDASAATCGSSDSRAAGVGPTPGWGSALRAPRSVGSDLGHDGPVDHPVDEP